MASDKDLFESGQDVDHAQLFEQGEDVAKPGESANISRLRDLIARATGPELSKPILNPQQRQELANQAPLMGGIAGGIAGGPLGAGLGGATGQTIKNWVTSQVNPSQTPSMAQAITGPIMEGGKQALLTATGEAVAPLVGKAASAVSQPIKDLLARFASKQAMAATQIPGAAAAKILAKNPNAGQQLLEGVGGNAPLVGFGDTQANIAERAAEQLKSTGQKIGQSLAPLDAGGAKISKQQILDKIESQLSDLKADPVGNEDTISQLEKAKDSISNGKADYTLGESEAKKRMFDDKVNYNVPQVSDTANKAVADAFRQSTEDAASALNPDLGAQFQGAKSDYGTLKPVADASTKRMTVAAQQSPNLMNLGKQGLGAIVGGEEGYRHGGLAGGLAGAVAGATIGPRLTSSSAVTANALSKVAGAAPQVLAEATPAVLQAAESNDSTDSQNSNIQDSKTSNVSTQSDGQSSDTPEKSNTVKDVKEATNLNDPNVVENADTIKQQIAPLDPVYANKFAKQAEQAKTNLDIKSSATKQGNGDDSQIFNNRAINKITGSSAKLASWPEDQVKEVSGILSTSSNPAHQRLGKMLQGVASGDPQKRGAMLFSISQNKDYRDMIDKATPNLMEDEEHTKATGGAPVQTGGLYGGQ